MVNVRRFYIYLVSAISLQAVTWSIIGLLRNLILEGNRAPVTSVAFQIAVIVIGLPIYLVHWLWAQRLVSRNTSERESALRRLYLYGMLAGFLSPFISNLYRLIANLFSFVLENVGTGLTSPAELFIPHIVAMVFLAIIWFYHQRIVSVDARAIPETGNSAAIHRLYVFCFTGTGLVMTTFAVINILRWIMYQFGAQAGTTFSIMRSYTSDIALLIAGVPLWLIFWRLAQQLFFGPSEEERESALRKFYLYITVFITLLSSVFVATTIIMGIFRRILSLPSTGDIRVPLAILITTAVVWAYHAYMLRQDASRAIEVPRQAGIRRLYRYLVAAVGLAAFLVGISGVISILFRSLSPLGLTKGLKNELAWFIAALIVGLPVWLLPWRQVQHGAIAITPAGSEERRSVVRKIYLYFYLFIATMTVLVSAVYIVTSLLSLVLGKPGEGNLLNNLGQAIAFILIGVSVWMYHGYALLTDGKINRRDQTSRYAEVRIAVVDTGEEHFGSSVVEGLQREMPGLNIDLIKIPVLPEDEKVTTKAISLQLAQAGLIIGPWTMTAADGLAGEDGGGIASAVIASPARKLLIPTRAKGWEWAGLDRLNNKSLVQDTVRAVKQMIEGEEVKVVRPMSAGAIVGIVIGVLFFLSILATVIISFASY